MARFIIVPRKGVEKKPGVNWYLRSPHIFMEEENNIPEISSTQIRNMLKNDDSKITQFIDPKVYEYIKEHHLYGTGPIVERYKNFIKNR
jgi:nicotinic acid mononucleotide adenylyltransferase